METPLLVDSLLRGERALERRLAGCALLHPQDVVAMDIRPEIDQAAVAFFQRLDKHKADLLAGASDSLRSINFAWHCAGRDAWAFYDAVRDLNAFTLLPTLPDEIRALRVSRKAATWIEQQSDLVKLIEQEAQPYE